MKYPAQFLRPNQQCFSAISFLVLQVVTCFGVAPSAYAKDIDSTICFDNRPARLSISQVTERTLRVMVTSLDQETHEYQQAPESSIVVPQEPKLLFQAEELQKPQSISALDCTVELANNPLTIHIRRKAGESVQKLEFLEHERRMTFRASAPVLGMGEGGRQLDRRGAKYSMKDGWGGWNRPVFGSWIAVPFLIGTDGWCLFVHHPIGSFDLREEDATFSSWEDQKHVPMVVYVTIWDRPEEAAFEFARLTGFPVLPPQWALGYMQSHRTLEGPEEILSVANTFREKQLPCDALIYLGTGYCPAGWNRGHGSLDFNPATFDQPKQLIDKLHQQNFRVVLHKNAPPQKLTGNRVTSVAAVASNSRQVDKSVVEDISHYWNRHRKAYSLGVDGWWPDDGDPLSRESRIARHRTYYEGSLLDRPNVRPWSLHRTGYAGVARFGGWIWSGDIDSRWETLKKQIAVGLNHGLSLSPFWGTDIGGFHPTKELTGELYVRWFQFAAFCPSFRAHGRTWHLRRPWGWNTGEMGPIEYNDGPDETELHNPAVEPICRKYLELRYRMFPYNYTLCRQAHDNNLPLMRALWLHYPNDARAVARDDEYLWGRDLLVAPVITKAATKRTLYLPEGDWYDFWTNELHHGGMEITRSIDLETIPLYVRAGAILPLDPVRQFTSQQIEEPTIVRIYAGADGQFRFYEDDGESQEYLDGAFAWTDLVWSQANQRLTIKAEAAGGLPGRSRPLIVKLIPSGRQKTIRFNGNPVAVEF